MTTTSPDIQVTEEALDHELARRDFLKFLEYVKVKEPPPGVGIIPFEAWPHLLKTADTFLTLRFIIILKSRQIGISWLLAAYALWMGSYHKVARIGLFSRTEKDSFELLDKCAFIHKQLPLALQTPSKINVERISFPEEHASIEAFASTSEAGRSYTFSLIIFDEADFHEYLDGDYSAARPTINDNGGQLILCSTSNKRSHNSKFKTLYRNYDTLGFEKVFLSWDVRPNRTEAWYADTIAGFDDESEARKEYPRTEDEALAPAQTLMAFDVQVLLRMSEEEVRKPIETRGPINIYRKYQPGKLYGAGSDTSHGTGNDHSVTTIMDLEVGYVVADIMSNRMDPETMALHSFNMLGMYQDPLWAIEANEWGELLIRRAIDLGYGNLFKRRVGKVKRGVQVIEEEYGWLTTAKGRTSRYLLWGDLISSFNDGAITVPSYDGLKQFWTVVLNPAKNDRPDHLEGANDDYPMAVGLTWQMRKHAHRGRAPQPITPGIDRGIPSPRKWS